MSRCNSPRRARSCTRCTGAASRGTPAPASPKRRAAPLQVSSKGFRTFSASASPPWSFSRCSSSTCRTVPPGGSTLGLRAGVLLRAPSRLQFAAGSARSRRRVPGHGQGAPQGRPRSHSRRRVQSHREGDHRGPTPSFRGLAHATSYILEDDRARYANYSGTGNTLNANHPIVRRMIVDSLRYWVETMHEDGFRFDLASILARDPSGQLIANPPVLWDIESDPVLAGTKLIAEAWDAAGLYQVGSFIGDSWK